MNGTIEHWNIFMIFLIMYLFQHWTKAYHFKLKQFNDIINLRPFLCAFQWHIKWQWLSSTNFGSMKVLTGAITINGTSDVKISPVNILTYLPVEFNRFGYEQSSVKNALFCYAYHTYYDWLNLEIHVALVFIESTNRNYGPIGIREFLLTIQIGQCSSNLFFRST